MDKATYEQIPETLEVRLMRVRVQIRGFRTRVLDIVTTLLDPELYTKADIAELYRQRWHAELDLRSIKIALGMDVLRCKTVAGVNKEVAAFLLVYNLVCAIACEAARRQRVEPGRVSFADALYWARHARAGEALPRLRVNPRRPWRVEPRAVKRRPKEYDRLNKPREQMRQALLDKAVAV